MQAESQADRIDNLIPRRAVLFPLFGRDYEMTDAAK